MSRFLSILLLIIILAAPAHADGREGGELVNTPGDDSTPAGPAPTPAATPIPPAGPFYGIGNPWAIVNQPDPGYCQDRTGAGAWGNLAWPTTSREIRPGRAYRQGHPAVDIVTAAGSEVVAVQAGRVCFAGWSAWGFGELVVLCHPAGWMTFTAHLSEVRVTCGQVVERGVVVGLSGQTGAATFEHVHFEIRRGLWSYDPLAWLEEN